MLGNEAAPGTTELDATGSTGRSSYAVCARVTRPTVSEAVLVRNFVRNWPTDENRMQVKNILSIADCRVSVADGLVLAEAPGDGQVVVIDIDNPGDDWVSIPWG